MIYLRAISRISFLIFFLFFSSCITVFSDDAQVHNYNVQNFGAVGNGLVDDADAIMACVNNAIAKSNGTVRIPPGTYYIGKPLIFNHIKSKVPLQIVATGATITTNRQIRHFLYFKKCSPGTSLEIDGLQIKGKDKLSEINRLFDGNVFTWALTVKSCNNITVKNCSFENIYGGGIHIYAPKFKTASKIIKGSNILIENNLLSNVIGFKPTKYFENGKLRRHDHYGDGIYISGGAGGIIRNNDIINNVNSTKHLGRGGIVLEYYTANYTVDNNRIQGYDRAIHVESSIGGHKITKNQIERNSTGIIISAKGPTVGNYQSKPLEISDNQISSGQLPSKIKTLTRPSALLFFYGTSKKYENSVIRNNLFMATRKMNLNNYILLIQQAKLSFVDNEIVGSIINKPNILLNRGAKKFNGNSLENLGQVISSKKIGNTIGNRGKSVRKSNISLK